MSFRTPLARARGLGSAKQGAEHWWIQRLTAVALIPLVLWFAWAIVRLTGAGYAAVYAWVGRPLNAALLLALIYALFHHSLLGLQVIIEDYVHSRWLEVSLMMVVRFASVLLGIAAAGAVLLVAIGQ